MEQAKMAIKNILTQNEHVHSNTELLQTLQKALPQYFDREGNFKADKFEAELKANNIAEARDGYRLGFVGKDYARLLTGQASETVIVPDVKHNIQPENVDSQNVFITGDNLEALRHLQNAYAGKIKMIYIDPPYNTGKEFVYKDKFEFSDEKLKMALGYTDAEIERLKSIQGKSSHSAWLTFMYPRLKIAQRLLTDDGVIFISIDDNEQSNLKLLMDDIFGEGNFVTQLNLLCNPKGRSQDKYFATNHEFITVYSKSILSKGSLSVEKDLQQIEQEYTEEDEGGKYRLLELRNTHREFGRHNRKDMFFPLYVEDSGKVSITPNGGIKILPIWDDGYEGCWTWGKDKAREEIDFLFGKQIAGKWKVFRKSYANGAEKMLKTILLNKLYITERGQKEFNELLNVKGRDFFQSPKSPFLIKDLIKTATTTNDIILDFFAGSGTTAHAVMQLNAEDKANRKYLLVQWEEHTNENSEARKAGFHTIDQISRERIKRAAQKIKTDNPSFNGDLGFKHYRLKKPEIQTIDKILEFNPNEAKLFVDDMIAPFAFGNESGVPTILQTWLIQDGYDFNTKVETVLLAAELKDKVYKAHYIPESATLYFINTGFSHEALKDLLNKIGRNEWMVNTIVVYPYSFAFEQMRELKNNLKVNVEIQITIIERY